LDGWQNVTDACTRDTGLGLHALELQAASIGQGHAIDFTLQWLDDAKWAGENFRVQVACK
jgi:hypothetical protein